MAKKTPIEKLEAGLTKILEEYEGEVNAHIQEVFKKAAQKGKTALKQSSPRAKDSPDDRPHYADNWFAKSYADRYEAWAFIRNKKPTAPMAHLLEYGHAKRNGGRVPGIPHIAPVRQMLADFVADNIKKEL